MGKKRKIKQKIKVSLPFSSNTRGKSLSFSFFFFTIHTFSALLIFYAFLCVARIFRFIFFVI